MTDRYEQTQEYIPDALDPNDEVYISQKSNNKRKYHLKDGDNPHCGCFSNAGFHTRELIQIVPTYTICTRCEDFI